MRASAASRSAAPKVRTDSPERRRQHMKTAIVNLGSILSGEWREPYVKGDSILMQDGTISAVGTVAARDVQSCDVVIDADGAVAIPGLIDSQVHNSFVYYTPSQRTVCVLESYMQGGGTT